MDDAALLQRYADTGSEDAFAELVRRHLPLVYGAVIRRVGGDVHLAQDVTQMVFAAAARDSVRLARHPNLPGWLFTTARFLAANAVRTERRRRTREQEAVRANGPAAEPAEASDRLRPVLDDALMELRELDRQMLLMRFYRGLRLAEIAAQNNSTENAVQKRIERALERLNAMLSRRGITSTAAAVALVLEQHAAVALPAGLTAASINAGLGSGAAGVGAIPVAAPTAKLPLYIAATLVVASSAGVVWYYRENARLRADLARTPAAVSEVSVAGRPSPAAAAAPSVSVAPANSQSNPAPPEAPPPAGPTQPPPARVAPVLTAPAGNPPGDDASDDAMVPLRIEYPRPLFAGTPRPIQLVNLERVPAGRRPDFMVPAGTRLLSKGKPVTSSDSLPVIGELSFVTDGDKSGVDGSYVELGPNPQWVQIDLGAPAKIAAIAVWHFHSQSRVYHDVIVQISGDPEFKRGVTTVFNNDHDNSSRLGRGTDPAYIETHQGRIIDARRTSGRYVRLYSNGNTSDELNHYCEVEVYGRPVGP